MQRINATLGWNKQFDQLTKQIAPRFARKELHARAQVYLRGLLNRVGGKNAWQIAKALGDATLHRIQSLLGRVR
jgi:hypothetical protein